MATIPKDVLIDEEQVFARLLDEEGLEQEEEEEE